MAMRPYDVSAEDAGFGGGTAEMGNISATGYGVRGALRQSYLRADDRTPTLTLALSLGERGPDSSTRGQVEGFGEEFVAVLAGFVAVDDGDEHEVFDVECGRDCF